jgi:hypothetical protein
MRDQEGLQHNFPAKCRAEGSEQGTLQTQKRHRHDLGKRRAHRGRWARGRAAALRRRCLATWGVFPEGASRAVSCGRLTHAPQVRGLGVKPSVKEGLSGPRGGLGGAQGFGTQPGCSRPTSERARVRPVPGGRPRSWDDGGVPFWPGFCISRAGAGQPVEIRRVTAGTPV